MFSLRDVLIFFIGVELTNTLYHIALVFYDPFPMKVVNFVISYNFNLFQIVFHGLVTIGLCVFVYHITTRKKPTKFKYERRARVR